MIDNNIAYNALISRDLRFDGIFFVGVTSTHILLPPYLSGKNAHAEKLPFLRDRCVG